MLWSVLQPNQMRVAIFQRQVLGDDSLSFGWFNSVLKQLEGAFSQFPRMKCPAE